MTVKNAGVLKALCIEKNVMKLANRFSDDDKLRYWVDHPYCALCMSNQGCSLHHIDGCKKPMHSSIYNSIMLCHTHHKEADGHNTDSPKSEAYRARLRGYTFKHIEKNGGSHKECDEHYLNHYLM